MDIAAGSSAHGATSTVVTIVITLAILALILYRQVQPRRTSPRLTVPAVLLILGIASLASPSLAGQGSAAGSSNLTAGRIGILIALLVLDAGGLGAVRAYTVRLWRDGQRGVLRQGTWLTIVLWLVGLGIHEGVDFLAHIPTSSALLYVGVTLLAQQAVLQTRVNRLEQQPLTAGTAPPGPGTPAGTQGSSGA